MADDLDRAIDATRELARTNLRLAREALDRGDRRTFDERYELADARLAELGELLDRRQRRDAAQ